MNTRLRSTLFTGVIAMLLVIFFVGCASPTPPATPVPPTEAPASPTAEVVPPTPTPLPTVTPTAIPLVSSPEEKGEEAPAGGETPEANATVTGQASDSLEEVVIAAATDEALQATASAPKVDEPETPAQHWANEIPSTFENKALKITFSEHAQTFIIKSEISETGVNAVSKKPFTRTHYILGTAELVGMEYDGLFRLFIKAVNWHGFSYEHDGKVTFTAKPSDFYVVGADGLSTERMFDKLTPEDPSEQFYNDDYRRKNYASLRAQVSTLWNFGIDDVAVSRLEPDLNGFSNGYMATEFADGGGIAPKENGVPWNILGWVYVDPNANPKEGLAFQYLTLLGVEFK